MHCCSVCRANAGTASAEPNRTHANRPMRSAIPPARLNTRSNTMPPASEFAFEKIETHVRQQCVGRYLFRGFAHFLAGAANAPASRLHELLVGDGRAASLNANISSERSPFFAMGQSGSAGSVYTAPPISRGGDAGAHPGAQAAPGVCR